MQYRTAVTIRSWSSCAGMYQVFQQELPCNAVAAEYPQCILIATPTCSSQSITALNKNYMTGQVNLTQNYH